MYSLRWRLIIGILAGITIVLAAGGTVTYLRIKERLYAEFDRSLSERALALTSFIEEDEPGSIEIDWFERGAEPPGHEGGVSFYQLSVYGGRKLLASAELAQGELPRLGESGGNAEFRKTVLPSGKNGRAAGIVFRPHTDAVDDAEDDEDGLGDENDVAVSDTDESGVVLQLVVARVDTVAPALEGIKRLLVGLWAACSLLSGLIIWFIVRRSLGPLDGLRSQISALQDTVSGQRIYVHRQPMELEPVTRELNRLLERVENALVRERNLTSNVAHELRTPISGLLTTLEVTLSRNRDAEAYRESSEECFEIASRMHWLVNNLLSLTRIEAGNVQLQHHVVNLEESLPRWWEPFANQAAERDLRVVWMIEPGARLETDPEFLRVVLTNLFDNAVSYVPQGGTVEVRADSGGHIAVGNDAIDVSSTLAEHAFDPFWRNTEAREEAGAHAGLGLSLCQKIVALLGGRIRALVRDSADWFEVRLELAPN